MNGYTEEEEKEFAEAMEAVEPVSVPDAERRIAEITALVRGSRKESALNVMEPGAPQQEG